MRIHTRQTNLLILLILVLELAVLSQGRLYHVVDKQIKEGTFISDQVDSQQQFWFEQIVDHFNYQTKTTWQQRYFVVKDYFDPATGPIILYICGESICNGVRDGSYTTVIAKETKGLILTLQHRYYGQSYPFGNQSLSTQNLKFLTSEQALMDLAYFLKVMTNSGMYGITQRNPWITIGGSYPGALSAWFRAKFPHLTVGAIGSSGVILAVQDFYMFDEQIYLSAMKSGSYCVDGIRAVTDYVEKQVTSDNRIPFQRQFKAENLTAREFLFYWSDVIVFQVQYGTRSKFCTDIKDKSLEEQFNFVKQLAIKVDPADYGAAYLKDPAYALKDGRGARSWIYQSCTQFSYFQTPALTHPMRSKLLTLDFYRGWCQNIFGSGVWPYVNRVNSEFGGLQIKADNLFMSNGGQDPWQWAGLRTSKGSIITQIADCDDCAHCIDLHAPNSKDSKSLVDLRNNQMTQVKKWIAAHWKTFQQMDM